MVAGWRRGYPLDVAATAQSVAEICAQARSASRALARAGTAQKDAALEAMALALRRPRRGDPRGQRTRRGGRRRGGSVRGADRPADARPSSALEGIAEAVLDIRALPDPVGETIDGHRLPNGLDLRRVRVPLGVVAVVYEARPNVTIDCSALCLKSGNAIVLRGSSTAAHSNAVLASVAQGALAAADLPEAAISLVAGGDRDEMRQIATQEGLIDLIIPRGGEGLKAALTEHATVPVMYAASGNCHVYVDAHRRPRRRAGDRRQRQGPAPGRVQRDGDPAGARRRGRRAAAARAGRAARVGRRAARGRPHPLARRDRWGTPSARPPRRTGPRSTWP